MDTIRQTKLIINKDAVKYNISKLQNIVGKNVKVMPVVKARAYGTGTGTLVDMFEELGIDILAVAVVDEGIALRDKGFKGEIIILNQPFIEEIDMILEYDLIPCVCVNEFIEELNKHNQVAKIHLEIDTGMGRTRNCPKRN